jgi:hypothetical protein
MAALLEARRDPLALESSDFGRPFNLPPPRKPTLEHLLIRALRDLSRSFAKRLSESADTSFKSMLNLRLKGNMEAK